MEGLRATAPPGERTARGAVQVFRSFRHRNYSIYWFGFLLSIIGFQTLTIGQQWLAYELTGSPLYLGAVGAASGLPTILLTLFGGVVADRVDRRRLLIFTQLSLALAAAVLTALAVLGWLRPWHLLATAFVVGTVNAFDQPARAALLPHLVERPDLMNAIALISAVWQSSGIIGPAIGGLLYGRLGGASCFAFATAGYGAMAVVLPLLHLQRAVASDRRPGWQDLTEGVRFIVRHWLFRSLIGLNFFNSIFGLSYIIMLPIIARDVLRIGPEGFGLLLTVRALGALIGTFTVATLDDFPHKGLLVLGGSFAFGLLLVLFPFAPWLPLTFLLLGASGWFNQLYLTTSMTTLQIAVPDQLRGRVIGIFQLNWSLMPLGGLQAGAVADLFGAPVAVAFGGGLVAALSLLLAVRLPDLRRLS